MDVPTGRVYISRDVVFDESIFPFASLHPNAGALLRKEILLLPENLRSFDQGGDNCTNQYDDNIASTSSALVPVQVGSENGAQNDENLAETDAIFNEEEEDVGAGHEEDPASPGTPVRQDPSDRARGSASDRVPGRAQSSQRAGATSSVVVAGP